MLDKERNSDDGVDEKITMSLSATEPLINRMSFEDSRFTYRSTHTFEIAHGQTKESFSLPSLSIDADNINAKGSNEDSIDPNLRHVFDAINALPESLRAGWRHISPYIDSLNGTTLRRASDEHLQFIQQNCGRDACRALIKYVSENRQLDIAVADAIYYDSHKTPGQKTEVELSVLDSRTLAPRYAFAELPNSQNSPARQ